VAERPFRTWPSWAKALVVFAGLDWKWKPGALLTDQVMVAWLIVRFCAE
jgi:hypothetical protein